MTKRDRKEYMREYQLKWMHKRRDEWISANGPCKKCGSADRLEVDHVYESEKKYNPSQIWSRKQEDRDRELAKCQVLCYDCHLKKTIEFLATGYTCGTHNAYASGCRCDSCKEAQRDYNQQWRKRKIAGE